MGRGQRALRNVQGGLGEDEVIFESLEKHQDHNGDDVYSLPEVRGKYVKVVELLPEESWLALNPKGDYWLDYALFTFNSQVCQDGAPILLNCIFHGGGSATFDDPATGLREMRHTYFSNEGYIFYLPMKTMRLAFDELSKYFDEE